MSCDGGLIALHGELVTRRDALNQDFIGGNSPAVTAIAACGGANPAEHTTDACDFPLVTSRQNMTGRGKSSWNFFHPNVGT
jgi:hypothetical protein